MSRLFNALVACATLCIGSLSVSAEPVWKDGLNDISVFAGPSTKGDFPGNSLVPFASESTDVTVVGLAYNRQFYQYDFERFGLGLSLGAEVGLAGRFGDPGIRNLYYQPEDSAEFWIGPSLRVEGLRVGPASFSFGVVGGVSVVTNDTSWERLRELRATNGNGDALVLLYLGPETSVTFDFLPNTSFFYRTHHRSGGENVIFLPELGGLGDVSNANVFGIRHRF